MAFVKLFSSITESSLWSETKDVRLLFVTMLAKSDPEGFIEASLPGLARVANLSLEETEAAVAILSASDPHSKNPDFQGKRIEKVEGGWIILNYVIYRERRNTEERQAYMRDYMRERRAAEKKVQKPVNISKHCKHSVSHGKPQLAKERRERREERGRGRGRGDTPSSSFSIMGIDTEKIRTAWKAGALIDLITAFGGNTHNGREIEWKLACDKRKIQTIAVIFWWRRQHNNPIKEPSGLRTALSDWSKLPLPKRLPFAEEASNTFGVELDLK